MNMTTYRVLFGPTDLDFPWMIKLMMNTFNSFLTRRQINELELDKSLTVRTGY